MAEAWLHQEEEPNHHNSHLFNNCTVGGSRELGDTGSASIEYSACQDEQEGVGNQHWLCAELLHCNEDIVSMVVDALAIVKWTWVKLGGDQKHRGQDQSPNAFPAHHVEWFLASRSLKNIFLKHTL